MTLKRSASQLVSFYKLLKLFFYNKPILSFVFTSYKCGKLQIASKERMKNATLFCEVLFLALKNPKLEQLIDTCPTT